MLAKIYDVLGLLENINIFQKTKSKSNAEQINMKKIKYAPLNVIMMVIINLNNLVLIHLRYTWTNHGHEMPARP